MDKRQLLAVSRLGFAGGLSLVVVLGISGRAADAGPVYTGDFATMSSGTINGQQGWSAINTSVDQGISLFAGQNVFRMSNAFGSGTFADYPNGPAIDPAGEPTTGASDNQFHMALNFQSATGAPQPGLFLSVGPAGSDVSSRQGTFFIYDDSGAGLNVLWEDYVGGNFVDNLVGHDLSYTAVHNLSLSLSFVPGAANDLAEVSVDGNAAGTFTDYEGLYGTPVAADTVLFKTFTNYDASSLGGSDTTMAGHGLYFDSLGYSVSVPEPASLSLLMFAGLPLLARRRKRA